ncbi:LCCL domain containing protein, putative [Babesia bigemina]|uniref:LCCL domain containing protein, putative n=2 Tax=Babesia bigemina TaxID=5866 RepID=A0A061DBM3_BABBI|nr:LCCL domain containing protein, putative [Babesia bigemina]CDR97337.1 LCCL domain containing protein, putative [Babesia bigemina]|eukprot:XP_012769523.1 LCCL domain containing protein, putative [Babesia bigemina]
MLRRLHIRRRGAAPLPWLALCTIVVAFLWRIASSDEWCKVATFGLEPHYEQCLPDGDTLVRYTIEVVPLRLDDMSLSADVRIKIIGDGRETKPITIASIDGTHTRLNVERIDVGDPRAIELDSGTSDWSCERITVFRDSKYWIFDCVADGSAGVVEDRPRYLLSGNKVYTVSIQTGSYKDSGTSGRISLMLIGPLGKSNTKSLGTNFYAGSYLTFVLKAADVGDVTGVLLSNSATSDPWYCEDIRVMSSNESVKTFAVKRWVGSPYESSVEVTTAEGTSVTNFNETTPMDIQCHTRAIDLYSGPVNKPFNVTVRCPMNCQASALVHVVGSSLHHSSSSICTSALYDGVLTPSGGEVVVSIVGALKHYHGAVNPFNHMESESYEPSPDKPYYSFYTFLNESIDNVESNVRLVDAYGRLSSFGRLEVLKNGKWGTVCNKGKFGAFNEAAANLVCRKLGFKHGVHVMESCSSVNDQNMCVPRGYAVSYAGLMCLGTEDDISSCIIEEPTVDCQSHKDDVIVKCTNTMPRDGIPFGTLRLVDASGVPTSTGTGRLEFYNDGFGSVCNESWSKAAAKIACQEMGYIGLHNGGLVGQDCSDVHGVNLCAPVTQKIAAVDFQCKGLERALGQCPHESADDIYCTHDQDVVLSCAGNGDPSEFRHQRRTEPFTPVMKKLPHAVKLTCYDNMGSHSELQTKHGDFAIAICPPGCKSDPAALKGTFIYTEDSAICKAAVHAGVLDDSGGEIVVIRAITQPTFYGSVMNGVTSLGAHKMASEFQAGAFLVSRATKHILSKQMKLQHATGSQADPKPLVGADTPPSPPSVRWFPEMGWKGFNGSAADFVSLRNFPNTEKLKTLRDFTFIVQMTPTELVGKWNTLFSFQGCGGLTCTIDNAGEMVLEENCRPELFKTTFFPTLGRRTTIAIVYYSPTRDMGFFVDGTLIASRSTEFDFSFQGDLILGKSAETDSDFFVGQLLSLEVFDYVMPPDQVMHHSRMLQSLDGNRIHSRHSSTRMTVEGNMCLSKCVRMRSPAHDSARHGSPTNPAIHLACHNTLEDERFNGATGNEFLVSCSRSCTDPLLVLKGSKVYTPDSSICKAAVHSGAIPLEGGEAVVTILHGQDSYDRCVGHYGVLSNKWNQPHMRSFSVRRAPRVLALSCQDPGLFVLKMNPGTRTLLRCPPGCLDNQATNVFGSGMLSVAANGNAVLGVYNPVSSLCQAAIHSGKLDNRGGEVEIEVLGSQESFAGSTANGVTSLSSGQYLKSFRVLRGTVGAA